jgi:sortase A
VRLTKINTLLLFGILLVNGYIIVMPFVPAILFQVQQHQGDRKQLQQALVAPGTSSAVISGNRLLVPAMLLDSPIYEGSSSSTLSKGLWRLPSSSTPTQSGNMVIVGHRFTYTNPEGVFYNLNKVLVGDEIGIFWNSKRYLYTVTTTEVVPPTDLNVQAPTNQSELTLYTCTPLWLPKNRLVVIAKLETAS